MKKYLFIAAAIIMVSCQPKKQTASGFEPSVFIGDKHVVEKAEAIFTAIGGKEKWAGLRSLYIRAIHEEPQLNHPYTSEIWRSIDTFRLRIAQKSPDFHNLGIFTENTGWISYIHRDTTRQLSAENLAGWKRENNHNVYVLLNRLSKAGKYNVAAGKGKRIGFYKDSIFLCAMEPDSLNRPHVFITKNPDGTENRSVFSRWDTTEGLVHSAGGGPENGSFSYITEEWTPSDKRFNELYNFRMNLSPSALLSDLDWLTGKWKNTDSDNAHFEHWKKTAQGLSGTGFMLRENDTVFLERMRIAIKDSTLYFIPAVAGQNNGQEVFFKWVSGYKDRHVFSNPEHDFPQHISYELTAPDTLRAIVWGTAKEQQRQSSFVFVRQE